jgi:hypothetical protein
LYTVGYNMQGIKNVKRLGRRHCGLRERSLDRRDRRI